VLALIGSSLDKMATEIRHLQRTEVREAQEYSVRSRRLFFDAAQEESIISEQISGLARVIAQQCAGRV